MKGKCKLREGIIFAHQIKRDSARFRTGCSGSVDRGWWELLLMSCVGSWWQGVLCWCGFAIGICHEVAKLNVFLFFSFWSYALAWAELVAFVVKPCFTIAGAGDDCKGSYIIHQVLFGWIFEKKGVVRLGLWWNWQSIVRWVKCFILSHLKCQTANAKFYHQMLRCPLLE